MDMFQQIITTEVSQNENRLADYPPVTRIKIQGNTKTEFRLNKGPSIILGDSKEYDLDLTGLGFFTDLRVICSASTAGPVIIYAYCQN